MANICPYGSFTHAVVRGIPETFGKAEVADGHENGDVSVDLAKAQRQFGCLTGALRQKVGLQLIEIPPDPELPESWRIEDVAVIQGNTALITRPYKHQRRSEVSQWGTKWLCWAILTLILCFDQDCLMLPQVAVHSTFRVLLPLNSLHCVIISRSLLLLVGGYLKTPNCEQQIILKSRFAWNFCSCYLCLNCFCVILMHHGIITRHDISQVGVLESARQTKQILLIPKNCFCKTNLPFRY